MRYYKELVFTAMALAIIGLGFSHGVNAQQADPPTDDEVNAVARQLYCPVCENVSLDVCPTQACAQWRGVIRDKLEAGWTESQIQDYFAAQYGDRVLASPPARGLHWLIYILPPLGLLLGALLVWRVLRQARRAAPLPVQTSPDDPYLKRLEDELKKGVS